jgi:hypothetical protein
VGEGWTPTLQIRETTAGCRLLLEGFAYGDGPTLQDASDALVARLLTLAVSFRADSVRIAADLGAPDLRWFEFLYELGEIAAAGGDIRDRIFGSGRKAA